MSPSILRKINKEQFNLEPKRFELRIGFQDAPVCPYGNLYDKIGFDVNRQEYVRFTAGVMKDEQLRKKNYKSNIISLGLGGGCHWCTEAVFQNVNGVLEVKQGWISSTGQNEEFSEAVFIDFDLTVVSLKTILEIHLKTHSSTSDHSMRTKYRSSVYFTKMVHEALVTEVLKELQNGFDERLVTVALPFIEFKLNKESQLDYFRKNKGNQFCERYIRPKLEMMKTDFENQVKAI